MPFHTPTPKLFPDPTPFPSAELGSVRSAERIAWVEAAAPRRLSEEARHLGTAISRRRIFICAGIFAVALLGIIGRLAYLQLARGEHFFARAEENRLRENQIPANRGVITDRKGGLLARNVPNFTLTLIPNQLPKDPVARSDALNLIATLAEMPIKEITEQIEAFAPYDYYAIALKDNLSYDAAVRLTVEAARVSGVALEERSRREYLTRETQSLSHLLGYVGKITREELERVRQMGYRPTDTMGKTGLERSAEDFLRGIPGARISEVNVKGEAERSVQERPPIPGYGVVLSVDAEMARVSEEALSRGLRGSRAKRGTLVALDPRDGEILALINLPTFDANAFSAGVSHEEYAALTEDKNAPLFPRAWAGAYPTGSTIKPFIAARALSDGLIAKNTFVRSVGGIQVAQWFFPDWKPGGHGSVNVVGAIAHSVNTFFYMVGGGYKTFSGLGPEKLAETFRTFGFGAPLGFELPGEASGFIPTPQWKQEKKGEMWYIGDTYNLSIGQGDLLASPLQVATATAALANGGTLFAPRVIRAIVDPQTGVEQPRDAKVIRDHILTDDARAIALEGMRAAVTVGSARGLAGLPIDAAGKTGTAQWSKTKPPHSWFTGFAPYRDPQIVITVLIEEGGEGSVAAVPVAREVLQWWATHRYPQEN